MELTIQQFIKAFGWSILNSLWQSAIIYGILFIIMFSLPKLAAKYRHNLAFGSILLMFIGFGFNLYNQVLLSLPKETSSNGLSNLHQIQYFNDLPESFSSKVELYFPIVMVFYIMGIMLQLFVIAKGYGQLSRLKKENLSSIPPHWKNIFEKVAQQLKINRLVKFHLSSIVNVPLVIGYLKPVVLFPLALVNELDNDQVEAILIHELSHVRRNDFLLNLIKTAIETLLFYNPFVWMAGRFMHIEREHACDDLVLRVTGKPLNYAHALLKLELLKDKNSPAFALAATGKSQNLYQRIKRITNMKTNYLNAKQQMAALTLGIACLFSIAWINPTNKKIEPKRIDKISLNTTISPIDLKTNIYLDTTKKKKIKIVTIDAKGNKTEYNSVKEMPDSVRQDFLSENLSFGTNLTINLDSTNFNFKLDTAGFAYVNQKFASPEFQARIASVQKNAALMAKKFDTPEWKENIAKIQKNALAMQSNFDTPEWKENIAKLQRNAEQIAKQFDGPEWKEKMAKIQKNAEEASKKYNSPEFKANMAQIQKNAENMHKKFESPEWKEKIKKLTELQNSPEYHDLKEKFEKDVHELQEKKEIKEKPERREKIEKLEQQKQ